MNTQDTTTSTLTLTRAGLLILEHAHRAGLPSPFIATATDRSIDFGFTTLDDLAAWSTWMDEPISDHEGAHGKTHYDVVGVALEQSIRCWHVAPSALRPLTVVPS